MYKKNIREKKYIFYGAGKRMARIMSYIEALEILDYSVFDSSPEKALDYVRKRKDVKKYKDLQSEIGGEICICITILDFVTKSEIAQKIRRDFGTAPENFIEYDDLINTFKTEFVKMTTEHLLLQENKTDVMIMNVPGFCLGGVETWVRDLYWGLIKYGRYKVKCVVGNDVKTEALDPYIDCVSTDEVERVEDMQARRFMKAIEYIVDYSPKYIILTHVDVFFDAALSIAKLFPNHFKMFYTIHGGRVENYTRVIDDSEYFKKILCCSELWEKILIGQGVDLERVERMECPFMCSEKLTRTYSADGEPIRIGWAGRIAKNFEKDDKRADLLLVVANKLKEKGIDFTIAIAGDGEGFNRFYNEVMQLGLSDRIELVGRLPKDEMVSFWQRQDVCILTSDSEGRSISFLEGMGCGAVPVVTNVSGIKEEVTNGYNGFYVPIGEMDLLVDRIKYLYDNRGILPEWGLRCNKIVFPKSSIERHIKYWEALFDVE